MPCFCETDASSKNAMAAKLRRGRPLREREVCLVYFKQICRILLAKGTKESLEYIVVVWASEEEKPSVNGNDRGSKVNVCE